MKAGCGTILIVDVDARFRAFVSRLFERGGYVTSEAATSAEAVAIAREARPGLVLMDVDLPDMSGFGFCQQLRDEFGDELPIVFVSGTRTEPLDRATGMLVGGDDYLVKPVDRDELLARARRLMSRSRTRRVPSSGAPGDGNLTQRELEVLQLLAEGRGSKEIAQALVISPKTVSSHIQRVIGKLGVHNRAQAVAVAYRDGLVEVPAGADGDEAVAAHLSVVAPEP